MRRVTGRGRILTLSVFVTVCGLGLPGTASAYGPGDGQGSQHHTDESGGSDGKGGISATVGAVVYDRSHNGSGQSAGPVTSTTNWTPPACYYAPKYSPAELKAYLEPIWNAESTGSQWDLEQRNKYEKGGDKPGTYKDFNKEKTGKGYWWDSYVTKGREGDPGALDCDKPYFWVDKGDPPPADIENAVTPEVLAELAYNEIRVPGTKVTLAPANATKVNLPTWAW
ncbi:hypothetical protein AB0H97_41315, partial [Streptomyces sp. NPDC050788]